MFPSGTRPRVSQPLDVGACVAWGVGRPPGCGSAAGVARIRPPPIAPDASAHTVTGTMASENKGDLRREDLKTRWLRLGDEIAAAREAGEDRLAHRLERRRDHIGSDFCAENKGLATVVARQFFATNSRANHDDYVGAALTGLWEAFKLWDPKQSTFGNYSRLYIEGRVKRDVATMEAEGISYGDFSARQKVRQAEVVLKDKLGRDPTTEEISKESEQTASLVDRVRKARPVSLDTPVGDGESRLGDLIPDDESDSDGTTDFYNEFDPHDPDFRRLLASAGLSAAELFVYVRRRGIDSASDQTLNEVGDMVGLGRETIRRHETRADGKVRELLTGAAG